MFDKLFEGEEQVCMEKRKINWPNTYRLIIKARVLKAKTCRKCKHTPESKRVWGYLIDEYWCHWSEYKGWKAIGTKQEAKKAGIEHMEKILGRKLN